MSGHYWEAVLSSMVDEREWTLSSLEEGKSEMDVLQQIAVRKKWTRHG